MDKEAEEVVVVVVHKDFQVVFHFHLVVMELKDLDDFNLVILMIYFLNSLAVPVLVHLVPCLEEEEEEVVVVVVVESQQVDERQKQQQQQEHEKHDPESEIENGK